MDENAIQKVIEILVSSEKDLKSLASIGARDLLSFFRSADLAELDLSGFDLRGLNFDYADVRGCIIDPGSFDVGAFNESIIDSTQSWLVDRYTFYPSDLCAHEADRILLFCRIRPGMIDDLIDMGGWSYREFSKMAAVGEGALRKARNDGVVSIETAVSVISLYGEKAAELAQKGDNTFVRLIQQPCIEFLSGGINSAFNHVSRLRLLEVREKKAALDNLRKGRGSVSSRDTPEAIDYLFDYYRRSEASGEKLRQLVEEIAEQL